MTWRGVQAGDIGFDRGSGLVGWLIRHGSHAGHAHTWIFHEPMVDGRWKTVEAYPGGVQWNTRSVDDASDRPSLILRLWRNDTERQAILDASEQMVGAGYDYWQLIRIIFYALKITLPRRESTTRFICSAHVAHAVDAARDDIDFSVPKRRIWPGRLAEDLYRRKWNDAVSEADDAESATWTAATS